MRAGNFTFDTCGSAVALGINIYKRTNNLSESEPRVMPLAWNGRGNASAERARREYLVPLHDYDTQYKTISTGLVRVQPEGLSKAYIAWQQTQLNDTDYPPVVYPTHATWLAVNGCPLSVGANRTYFVEEPGDYFLESAGATFDGGCGYINIRYSTAASLRARL